MTSRSRKPYQCSACGQVGHNKRTCAQLRQHQTQSVQQVTVTETSTVSCYAGQEQPVAAMVGADVSESSDSDEESDSVESDISGPASEQASRAITLQDSVEALLQNLEDDAPADASLRKTNDDLPVGECNICRKIAVLVKVAIGNYEEIRCEHCYARSPAPTLILEWGCRQ